MFPKAVFQLLAAFTAASSALPTSNQRILPGKFIVELQPDARSNLEAHTQWVSHVHSRNLARRGGDSLGIEQTYSFSGFNGYAGSFDEETLEAIKANPDVSTLTPHTGHGGSRTDFKLLH